VRKDQCRIASKHAITSGNKTISGKKSSGADGRIGADRYNPGLARVCQI